MQMLCVSSYVLFIVGGYIFDWYRIVFIDNNGTHF